MVYQSNTNSGRKRYSSRGRPFSRFICWLKSPSTTWVDYPKCIRQPFLGNFCLPRSSHDAEIPEGAICHPHLCPWLGIFHLHCWNGESPCFQDLASSVLRSNSFGFQGWSTRCRLRPDSTDDVEFHHRCTYFRKLSRSYILSPSTN